MKLALFLFSFLALYFYPKNNFLEQVSSTKKNNDSLYLERVKIYNTTADYQEFIKNSLSEKYKKEAEELLNILQQQEKNNYDFDSDTLAFFEARNNISISSMKKYIKKYPKGVFRFTAKKFIELLKKNSLKLNCLSKQKTVSSISNDKINNKKFKFYSFNSQIKRKFIDYNMVFVPEGILNKNGKQINIDAFMIDETEVSNYQYRQFVNWVRDSIAMRLCVKNGLSEFQIVPKDYLSMNIEFYDPTDPNRVHLNWKNRKKIWNTDNIEIQMCIKDMFLSNKNINPQILVYEYYYVDIKKQTNKKNIYQGLENLEEFSENKKLKTISYNYKRKNNEDEHLVKHKKINIYPDTTIWKLKYNDPIINNYFSDPAFNYYPVVGITYNQAYAFCNWRTFIVNNYLAPNEPTQENYRLPTEAEWEYAAYGKNYSKYPWGDQNPNNKCNFIKTPSYYTNYVREYDKGNNQLYNMGGNVAEWTSSSYLDNENYKILKGGSWAHDEYFLQNSNNSYMNIDSVAFYAGFRCIRSYIKWEKK